MKPRDAGAAVAVAFVWGLVFIAIKVGVAETTPLTLSALRFAFAALPVVFFVRPPKTSPWLVTLYGLFIGVGQFGLLFMAIRRGFPVGLASLLIQAQAFFTIFLAWALMGERPLRAQIIGALIAALGAALIASRRLEGASLGPLLMVVAASAFWGVGNIVAKYAGRVDMLAFVSWSSLAPPLPLLLLSAATEGTGGIVALAHPSVTLVVSVAVLAYAGTVFGFGVWSRLMTRYSAATVAPFALLVPIVGMIAGATLFGERLGPFELSGAVLVLAGLGFNFAGDRLLRRWLRPVR